MPFEILRPYLEVIIKGSSGLFLFNHDVPSNYSLRLGKFTDSESYAKKHDAPSRKIERGVG